MTGSGLGARQPQDVDVRDARSLGDGTNARTLGAGRADLVTQVAGGTRTARRSTPNTGERVHLQGREFGPEVGHGTLGVRVGLVAEPRLPDRQLQFEDTSLVLRALQFFAGGRTVHADSFCSGHARYFMYRWGECQGAA